MRKRRYEGGEQHEQNTKPKSRNMRRASRSTHGMITGAYRVDPPLSGLVASWHPVTPPRPAVNSPVRATQPRPLNSRTTVCLFPSPLRNVLVHRNGNNRGRLHHPAQWIPHEGEEAAEVAVAEARLTPGREGPC